MSLIQCFLSVDFNRVEKVSRTLDIFEREEEIGMSYQENVWQRTVRLGELKTNFSSAFHANVSFHECI